jgi:hypothetical protein
VQFHVSKVSQRNFQKIAEQALGALFEKYPQAVSTHQLALELGRDNEFVGKVLGFLHGKRYVALARVSASGRTYSTKKLWRLSEAAHRKYSGLSSARTT